MTESMAWKSARMLGLAALGVSMALAPGLSAQSLARSAANSAQRARIHRAGGFGGNGVVDGRTMVVAAGRLDATPADLTTTNLETAGPQTTTREAS